MTFYARGRKEKNFEAGIGKAVEAILASPQFLFRVEESPARLTTAGFVSVEVPCQAKFLRQLLFYVQDYTESFYLADRA